MVSRFRFALTSERWVEALHAISKHIVSHAHNIGPVHIAFHAILEPLRRWLKNSPETLSELSRDCMLVRNPMAALTRMGLSRHPSAQKLLLEGGQIGQVAHMNRKHTHEITEILYHVDTFTLQQHQPDSLPMLPPGPPGDE